MNPMREAYRDRNFILAISEVAGSSVRSYFSWDGLVATALKFK